MVGFIFGIIVLLAGVICGVIFGTYKRIEKQEEYALDENGSRIPNGYGGYKTVITKKEIKPYKKVGILSLIGGVFFGILFTFFGCMTSVTTGNTGVVTTFGRVENYTLEAGFHIKAPWHTVTEMDNRVQKTTVELSCFSADIQEVTMRYTLNYQIDKSNAQEIYKTVGTNYYATIIEPTIAEAVKVAAAHYTAEQLVQTRSNLAADIEELLETNLGNYNIKVSSTAIEDMDFTDAFTTAVENKQVAEQKKKQAEIEQAQALAQAENDRKIAETMQKQMQKYLKFKLKQTWKLQRLPQIVLNTKAKKKPQLLCKDWQALTGGLLYAMRQGD